MCAHILKSDPDRSTCCSNSVAFNSFGPSEPNNANITLNNTGFNQIRTASLDEMVVSVNNPPQCYQKHQTDPMAHQSFILPGTIAQSSVLVSVNDTFESLFSQLQGYYSSSPVPQQVALVGGGVPCVPSCSSSDTSQHPNRSDSGVSCRTEAYQSTTFTAARRDSLQRLQLPSFRFPILSGQSDGSSQPPRSSIPGPGAVTGTSTLCAICDDKASGRHYGIISCEGCKGFFKRTVRKQLEYICRGSRLCPVDRRKRTRCQACRYDMCIAKGMKREAVQEERRHKPGKSETKSITASMDSVGDSNIISTIDPPEAECSSLIKLDSIESVRCSMSHSTPVASTSAINPIDLPDASRDPAEPLRSLSPELPQLTLGGLLAAELSSDSELPITETGESVYIDIEESSVDPLVLICHSVEGQLPRLLTWARHIPCFSAPYLSVDNQFWLIKSAWAELLLISAAFNSIVVNEGLLLANGHHLSRSKARQHGLGPLMDRFLTELVGRFRELGLERVELALLRAIILFNPDANNLTARNRVESVRESLYAALHAYCAASHRNDTSRFTKLLLRLPPLRSIAHKCLEHLVFVKLAAEDPTSRRLINLVEHGVWPSTDNLPFEEQFLGATASSTQ